MKKMIGTMLCTAVVIVSAAMPVMAAKVVNVPTKSGYYQTIVGGFGISHAMEDRLYDVIRDRFYGNEDITEGMLLGYYYNKEAYPFYLDFGFGTQYVDKYKEMGLLDKDYQLPKQFYTVTGDSMEGPWVTDCPELKFFAKNIHKTDIDVVSAFVRQTGMDSFEFIEKGYEPDIFMPGDYIPKYKREAGLYDYDYINPSGLKLVGLYTNSASADLGTSKAAEECSAAKTTPVIEVNNGTWKNINGKWYYNYPVSQNVVVMDAWAWINGKCYRFAKDGALYTSCTTPDGYTVNEKGEWTVNGVVQT
ncbi:MAG: hypothetical protein PUC98_07640, partial [Clostridiales bacterium]|nr:hypothetical protein [Clostridiales bacterium]